LSPDDLRVAPAVQRIEAASAAAALPDSAPQQEPLAGNYIMGPEDVLDIDVFNVPELAKSVRVANDGTIVLSLIGRVKAAGLTSEQLREELEKRYRETYLQNPQVSVFIKEFHAQPVSIIGAVERPGLYQLTGPRSLIEMLAMAGGLAKKQSAPAGRTLFVTRKGGFEDVPLAEGMNLVAPDKLEINIQRLLYSREGALNIPIHPADTISVTKADIVYVVGSVKKPGGFVLEDREKVTVLQALAMAEGLFGSPSKNSARIIHRAEDGGRSETPVDIGKVMKGQAPDIDLAPNDILFIPESGGKMAAKRGAEAAIATITGVIIWRRP
jgi:polysaccharide export outer membrane protein